MSAEDYLIEGIESLTEGNYSEALDYLQKAGEKIGEKATKYYGLAKDKASKLTEKVTEKVPEVVEDVAEKGQEVVANATDAIVWKQQSNLDNFKSIAQKHSDIVQKAVEAADKAFEIAQEQVYKLSEQI